VETGKLWEPFHPSSGEKMESQCYFHLHFFYDKDVEHLFMCLLVICIYSFESYPFNSFAHLLFGLFVLGVKFFELFIYSRY
jgi:hypothetical protein